MQSLESALSHNRVLEKTELEHAYALLGDRIELTNYSNRKVVHQFEIEFCNALANDDLHGVATNSCTSALKIALLALGIGAGDEVIVPGYGYISDASVLEEIGAIPKYVDINLKNFCMDIESVSKAVSEKTKAILFIHMFGFSGNVIAVSKLAKKYSIPLIEDIAHGTVINRLGNPRVIHGDAACFSFNQTKIMSAEEGGIVVFKRITNALKGKSLVDNGFDRQLGHFNGIGYSYRMTSFQAAVLLAQLANIHEKVEKWGQNYEMYYEMLSSFELFATPYNKDDVIIYFPVMVADPSQFDNLNWIKTMLDFENIPFMNTNDEVLPKYLCNDFNISVLKNSEIVAKSNIKFLLNESIQMEIIEGCVLALKKIQNRLIGNTPE